jgi:hypothetical protein
MDCRVKPGNDSGGAVRWNDMECDRVKPGNDSGGAVRWNDMDGRDEPGHDE